jgi:hypothetical protein
MTAAAILNTLHDAGLTIALSNTGGITVTSATRPPDDLRDLIRANKAVLLKYLHAQAENDPTPATLAQPAPLHAANDPVASKAQDRADDPPDVAAWIDRRRVKGHEGMRPATLAKFAKASAALDHQAADAADSDPDRWYWPRDPSPDAAMNSGEIKAFVARVTLFVRHGFDQSRAEALADKLKTRDREGDDRVVCVECRHLASNRCTRPQAASLGPMVEVFRAKLQRCPAFDGVVL